MAQRIGEEVARRHGMTALPVDPFLIAAAEGIRVQPLPADESGVSGVFLMMGTEAAILYRASPGNPGFERFSVAHELGHYFLEGHPQMIMSQGGRHSSNAGFKGRKSALEVEADQFAAALLMPVGPVRALLAELPVGLDAILALRDRAAVSIRAAAIACARHADRPVAVIVSHGDQVDYAFLSPGFRRLGRLPYPRKGQPLPATVTAGFNADPSAIGLGHRAVGTCRLCDWFDGARALDLDEEIIGLGRSGRTLTVLSSEDLAREDEDGAEDGARSDRPWQPRFR